MRTVLKIFSIAIYLFLAFIFKIKIQKEQDRSKIKNILFIYLIIIVILSFFFYSYYEIDLNRLQERLGTFSNMRLDTFLKNVTTVTNYGEYTYFFLISKLGNPNFLQTFTSLIFYSIIFYTLFDYYKIKELSNRSLANTLFLFMICGPYVGVVSGVRTYLAFSLLYFCLYREFIKNKSTLGNLPIYFVSIGMHNAILPIVLVRFLWLSFQREKKLIIKVLNIFISSILLYLFIKNGSEIINYTYTRANLYLENNIYSNFYGYIVTIINFIIIVYFYLYTKKNINNDYNLSRYKLFIILIIILSFIFINQYSIFTRYMGAVFIFNLPLFMFSFDYILKTKNQAYRHYFYFGYYVLIFINIIIYYNFGDNSLINFFNVM